MGPLPQAVPPPPRVDASFTTLQPDLDAFANAMVAIENLLPAGGSGGSGGGGPLPAPETFYFKIPGTTAQQSDRHRDGTTPDHEDAGVRNPFSCCPKHLGI
jgi:hypothetical protein